MAGNQLLAEWQQSYNGVFQKHLIPFLLRSFEFSLRHADIVRYLLKKRRKGKVIKT
jgi:hypothetical protein